MKKIIGAVVGGLLIFIWQTLSWAMLNLHHANLEYTPKQDSVMAYLNSQFSEDGGYLLPSFPKGASYEEMEKKMPEMAGKPWAQIQYHKANNTNMVANMAQGFVVNIILVWMFCWIIGKIGINSFGTTFIASIFTGLIVFLNSHYTMHIWYKVFDLQAHLLDAVVSWALAGIWLGWWLNRERK